MKPRKMTRDKDLSVGVFRTKEDVDTLKYFSDKDVDRDNEYRILRRTVIDRPITHMTLNGRIYNALLVRDPIDVMVNHFNLDVEEIVRDCFEVADLSKFNSLAEQYRELSDWRAELVDAAGDGWLDFEGAVSDSLVESGKEALWEIYDSVNDEVDKRYFRGTESTVMDLSVVNGVWTFDFASLSYAAEDYLIPCGLVSKFWE